MIFLYGSEDSGARNYFSKLFKSYFKESKQFINESDLFSLEEDLLKRNKSKPTLLTGSALGSDTLDKKAILLARKWKLKCFSIIEHWSWYRRRFESRNQLLIPNKIFVNDIIAKKAAISDGLPDDKLVVLGNPVLEDHAIRSSKFRGLEANDIRKKYKIKSDKIIICFVSESLKEIGEINDSLGFDEFYVFSQLREFFKDNKYHILIKSHPADQKNKFGKSNQKFSYIEKLPIEDLAVLADKIIGMGSMLLIELSFYRNDIISYRPNSLIYFIGNLLDITIPANDFNTLEIAMKSKALGLKKFRNSHIGSTKRIINYIEKN